MVEFQSSQQKIECLRKPDYIFDLLQIIYDKFPKIRVMWNLNLVPIRRYIYL
jgi:hypothetical protein